MPPTAPSCVGAGWGHQRHSRRRPYHHNNSSSSSRHGYREGAAGVPARGTPGHQTHARHTTNPQPLLEGNNATPTNNQGKPPHNEQPATVVVDMHCMHAAPAVQQHARRRFSQDH
jgi:hypothetical protein